MHWLSTANGWIRGVLSVVVIISVVGLTGTMTVQVILRYFLQGSLMGVEEMSTLFGLWLYFAGLALVTTGRCPRRMKRTAGRTKHKKPSFHEDFSRAEEVKSSSDRGFGLTVGGILLLIALARAWFYGLGWLQYGLGAIAIALIVVGLAAPGSLRGLNRAWTRLGLILSRVVNPLVLALIYATTMVPIGLLMRASGRDPLRLRPDPEAHSYWIVRDPPGPAPETMTNQF